MTDRDPCFNDIEVICFSKITGEKRCKLFFCDPYVSNQKLNVEKHNITLLNTPIKSLDGYNPKDAFISVYGEDLYNKIFDIVNGERK